MAVDVGRYESCPVKALRPTRDAWVETKASIEANNDELKGVLPKTYNLQANANLRRTRDLLLPKLISGEVDVCEFSSARMSMLREAFCPEAWSLRREKRRSRKLSDA